MKVVKFENAEHCLCTKFQSIDTEHEQNQHTSVEANDQSVFPPHTAVPFKPLTLSRETHSIR